MGQEKMTTRCQRKSDTIRQELLYLLQKGPSQQFSEQTFLREKRTTSICNKQPCKGLFIKAVYKLPHR